MLNTPNPFQFIAVNCDVLTTYRMKFEIKAFCPPLCTVTHPLRAFGYALQPHTRIKSDIPYSIKCVTVTHMPLCILYVGDYAVMQLRILYHTSCPVIIILKFITGCTYTYCILCSISSYVLQLYTKLFSLRVYMIMQFISLGLQGSHQCYLMQPFCPSQHFSLFLFYVHYTF